MKKTVKELIKMYDEGNLITDHTTQRKFIYAVMPETGSNACDGAITKMGSVIKSIMEHKMQLPALYFWHNTETHKDGQYNIHDGKQRLLSIIYFIRPVRGVDESTTINGQITKWNMFTSEQQQHLLNYEFDIVVRSGTSLEEETSFHLINSTGEPLTEYETLRGSFHGKFIYDFEKILETYRVSHSEIEQIARGSQAMVILYAIFGLTQNKYRLTLLREEMRRLRHTSFDDNVFNLQVLLKDYCDYKQITHLKDEYLFEIIKFMGDKKIDKNKFLGYLVTELRDSQNDIARNWKINEYKCAAIQLMKGISLHGKRFFAKQDGIKDSLYQFSPRCVSCNESSYNHLEVDHIVSWSQGGRTNAANAQLMCKQHNTSKGANSWEVL